MVKYREILRLTYLGISQENIAFSCGCARSTVQLIQKLAKSKGLEWPLPGEMDDAAIRAVLYPPKETRDDGKFAIDHEWIEREMGKPGVTMTLLWSEYCVKATDHGADPFMYSAFCQRHRKWAQRNRITLHIDRRPAEEMQVDWAGKCPAYCDPDTGEIRKAHVFVACLPYSSMIFAWPYPNMGEESWIDGHIRAFREFGGTTPIVVPDNCKTGVIKNTVEELVVNEQYRLMCEHYGVAVVPARVRRPKDKAAVEMSVGVVERKVIAAMRDRVFIGIAELAAAIDEAVDSINSAPFQKRAGSRREAFLGREKDRLQPLPPTHYEMTVRKTATVQFNYHVSFDKRYYSVPAAYVRREVGIVAARTTVAVICDGERIAMHRRSTSPAGAYVTDPAHMPDSHREWTAWSGDRFRSWAAGKGEAILAVVDGILKSRKVEQQAYRSARALLGLADKHGDALLERACAKALTWTARPSYKTVKTALQKIAAETAPDPDAGAYRRPDDCYDEFDGCDR